METHSQRSLLPTWCLQWTMPWHSSPYYHHHAVQQIRKDWTWRYQRKDFDWDNQANLRRVQEGSWRFQSPSLWYNGHQSEEVRWRFLGLQGKNQVTLTKACFSGHSRIWWQRYHNGQIQTSRLFLGHPQSSYHSRWAWKETCSFTRYVQTRP